MTTTSLASSYYSNGISAYSNYAYASPSSETTRKVKAPPMSRTDHSIVVTTSSAIRRWSTCLPEHGNMGSTVIRIVHPTDRCVDWALFWESIVQGGFLNVLRVG